MNGEAIRAAVMSAYPGEAWRKRVKAMDDYRVFVGRYAYKNDGHNSVHHKFPFPGSRLAFRFVPFP